MRVHWLALSLSSLHSGTGSYAAVQPHGFSDTCILRHRQSLTHKLIDLWFVVRVENSCCRLIKYSRRFNAKYWKTLSGRRVKFLKTCLSRGSRPVQEDLHLAMINVSSGPGGGLEGCQAHGVKFTLGLALWISYISLRPWFFQGVQQSCSAWTGRSKSSPTWAEALQHIGRAGWSPRCSFTSPYLRGQMESLFLQGCQFGTFHQLCKGCKDLEIINCKGKNFISGFCWLTTQAIYDATRSWGWDYFYVTPYAAAWQLSDCVGSDWTGLMPCGFAL